MRCIVVDVNVYQDKETKEPVCSLTCYAQAKKGKNGLWHFKKEDAIYKITRFSKNQPDEYVKLSHIMPGTLIDITLGVNEYTQKTKIATYDVVPDTDIYTEDLLYLE